LIAGIDPASGIVRAELDKAFKASDEAHKANDGQGKLPPPSAETAAHLHLASDTVLRLAGDVGAKPMTLANSKSV
jgi:hypothetical protein